MNVVTGAFGYIGRYIARHLLGLGEQVKTVTTHPDKPNPFGNAVEAFPYNFDRPNRLIASLRGASTLYNTYWIRFEYGGATFQQAVQNTVTLFDCAKKAGIKKIVHISVTHASVESRLPYYNGKGSGAGQYLVQPVYVGDLAAIAVACAKDPDSRVLDAIGPETFTFKEFVKLIALKLKPSVKLVEVPPAIGIALGQVIGRAVGDVVLTKDELRGLMAGMLTSTQVPNGTTRFSQWLELNKDALGTAYSSELGRHFRWRRPA